MEHEALSGIAAGSSGFLSSCDGYLGYPLELHKRKTSLLSSCENVGLVSSHCRGNRASSRVELILWFSLVATGCLGFLLEEFPPGPQGTSRVASGKSGLLWSCKGTSGFLLSHYRGIGPHLELQWEIWGSCQGF